MRFIVTFITFTFIINFYGQTEIEHKNQIIDSLKSSKVDTILILKKGCYGCGNSYVGLSLKDGTCNYYETYTIFWIKNGNNYFKQINRCYESNIIKNQSNKWCNFYIENRDKLNSLKIIKSDSILQINQDIINFSKCNGNEITKAFSDLSNQDFFEYEIILNDFKYISGEITNYLLCDYRTKNRNEIIILNQFYNIIYSEYIYQFENNFELKKKIEKNWENNE
jgi:hypothetical protein